MGLINTILNTKEFRERPPVLIDIGASGAIHKKWKRIAPYAICIAFDADERDFDPGHTEKSRYKKLLIKKSLVNDKAGNNTAFYLTRSPHCSSLLMPNQQSLADWSYAPQFQVEKKLSLNTTDIPSTLASFGIGYIDWYKSDSQGIDLRLFKSLPDSIRDRITVAEFEPGILDAYIGEDKLPDTLQYQDALGRFWLADLVIKGRVRLSYEKLSGLISSSFLQKVYTRIGKPAPGWAEMTYLNHYKGTTDLRALLMGWICATLLRQHGFAYTLACTGMEHHDNPLFKQMKRASRLHILWGFVNFRYLRLFVDQLRQ